MRLKVSPKAAIQKLDLIVREGAALKNTIFDIREAFDAKVKEAEATHHAARNQAAKAYNSEPESVEIEAPTGKIQMPNPHKAELLVELNFDSSAVTNPMKKEGAEDIWQRYSQWMDRTQTSLEEVFIDFTPIHSFSSAKPPPEENGGSGWLLGQLSTAHYRVTNLIEAKLKVVTRFYDDLVTNLRSPLIYLPDQHKLCFYDLVCPLKANTNEASLCDFMFRFSIGEKIEMFDIYNFITGEDCIKLDAKSKEVVVNAYDGINRKTNESFGFPILKKEATTLCLVLPTRITTNLS